MKIPRFQSKWSDFKKFCYFSISVKLTENNQYSKENNQYYQVVIVAIYLEVEITIQICFLNEYHLNHSNRKYSFTKIKTECMMGRKASVI